MFGRLFGRKTGAERFAEAVHWGLSGWLPGGQRVARDSEQIGAYGDVVLTRRWMLQPGVQLNSSRGLTIGWMAPPGFERPELRTVRPGNLPGAQRQGAPARVGMVTPWVAAQMQGELVKAQLAQSAAGSVEFYRALIRANLEAA